MFSELKLSLELGGAAMQTPTDVAAALRRVADKIEESRTSGVVTDINGNTVGEWEFLA